MTSPTDPRRFLYRADALDPDLAQALAREALAKADDGELYLQYRATESFGFDDGRLKTASTIRPTRALASAPYRAR
jgi:TldD protein